MKTAIGNSHIVIDKKICNGEPVVAGTKTTIRAIVELWRMGIHPEEITLHLQHLNLSQVFAALSYYSEHQEEINEYITKNHVPDEIVHPYIRGMDS